MIAIGLRVAVFVLTMAGYSLVQAQGSIGNGFIISDCLPGHPGYAYVLYIQPGGQPLWMGVYTSSNPACNKK